VVVDHHDSYTHNLVHLIAAVTGTLPVVVEHDEVSASDLLGMFTHIVLSPGPGHPEDPADFAVGRLLLKQDDIPVLGVCLGMQGLVCAYGGRVTAVEPAHGEVVPIRHTSTGLFSGVPAGFRAVRYHSLAAVNMPYELRVTARTDDDVVMAVEHRWKPLFGVQFHPESILTEHGSQIVSNFMSLPSAGRPSPRPQ
jgi:anthranilate synthase component II